MKDIRYRQLNNKCQVEVCEKMQSDRKQIGLLGGSFNPVHLGHLVIADQVFHQLCLDQIYLMPTYFSPHVDVKTAIDSQLRLEMLELAVQQNKNLKIETLELERKGKSYTYDTICTLKEQHPENDYYFIIGGDMVEYLPKWYNIDKLVELVQFVGVKRSGSKMETPYPLIWVDVPLIDISSSLVRAKIKQGCSVRYLVPDAVLGFIQERGLYRDE